MGKGKGTQVFFVLFWFLKHFCTFEIIYKWSIFKVSVYTDKVFIAYSSLHSCNVYWVPSMGHALCQCWVSPWAAPVPAFEACPVSADVSATHHIAEWLRAVMVCVYMGPSLVFLLHFSDSSLSKGEASLLSSWVWGCLAILEEDQGNGLGQNRPWN